MQLPTEEALALVPVAAILVASIRLHCLNRVLNAQTQRPLDFSCDVAVTRGYELGWFEHGSTIIMLVPAAFKLAPGVFEGGRIRAGEPLLRWP